jgi:hypothetical protein
MSYNGGRQAETGGGAGVEKVKRRGSGAGEVALIPGKWSSLLSNETTMTGVENGVPSESCMGVGREAVGRAVPTGGGTVKRGVKVGGAVFVVFRIELPGSASSWAGKRSWQLTRAARIKIRTVWRTVLFVCKRELE